MEALTKIKNLLEKPRPGSLSTPIGDVGSLLRQYMLGIITALNDFLQEPPTKRSPGFKKKILNSFGPFVMQIGPAASNIAPQVRGLYVGAQCFLF